jgi:hypothetical protein
MQSLLKRHAPHTPVSVCVLKAAGMQHGVASAPSQQSEKEQRLERIVARLREPMQNAQPRQAPAEQPTCSASKVWH